MKLPRTGNIWVTLLMKYHRCWTWRRSSEWLQLLSSPTTSWGYNRWAQGTICCINGPGIEHSLSCFTYSKLFQFHWSLSSYFAKGISYHNSKWHLWSPGKGLARHWGTQQRNNLPRGTTVPTDHGRWNQDERQRALSNAITFMETSYLSDNRAVAEIRPNQLNRKLECNSRSRPSTWIKFSNVGALKRYQLQNWTSALGGTFHITLSITLKRIISKWLWMLHQFYVDDQHHDFLCFLWWEGGDILTNAREYWMQVHLFGTNYGLKHVVRQNKKSYPLGGRIHRIQLLRWWWFVERSHWKTGYTSH